MRYCPKCQRVCEKEDEQCPFCKGRLKSQVGKQDPVFLIDSYGFDLDRIRAALEDEHIPFVERFKKKERSADALTGKNDAVVNLYVLYETLEKARDTLIGIGVLEPPFEIKEQSQETEKTKELIQKDEEEMSTKSRLFWRVISIVLFIVTVWAVVAGIDFVTALVKGLF